MKRLAKKCGLNAFRFTCKIFPALNITFRATEEIGKCILMILVFEYRVTMKPK